MDADKGGESLLVVDEADIVEVIDEEEVQASIERDRERLLLRKAKGVVDMNTPIL